jgi:hypothetical protein
MSSQSLYYVDLTIEQDETPMPQPEPQADPYAYIDFYDGEHFYIPDIFDIPEVEIFDEPSPFDRDSIINADTELPDLLPLPEPLQVTYKRAQRSHKRDHRRADRGLVIYDLGNRRNTKKPSRLTY